MGIYFSRMFYEPFERREDSEQLIVTTLTAPLLVVLTYYSIAPSITRRDEIAKLIGSLVVGMSSSLVVGPLSYSLVKSYLPVIISSSLGIIGIVLLNLCSKK